MSCVSFTKTEDSMASLLHNLDNVYFVGYEPWSPPNNAIHLSWKCSDLDKSKRLQILGGHNPHVRIPQFCTKIGPSPSQELFRQCLYVRNRSKQKHFPVMRAQIKSRSVSLSSSYKLVLLLQALLTVNHFTAAMTSKGNSREAWHVTSQLAGGQCSILLRLAKDHHARHDRTLSWSRSYVSGTLLWSEICSFLC